MATLLLTSDVFRDWFDKYNDLTNEVNALTASSAVIEDDSFGSAWDTDTDGASKNSLYDILNKLIPAPPVAILSNATVRNTTPVRQTGTGATLNAVNADTVPNIEVDITMISDQLQDIQARFPVDGVNVLLNPLILTAGDDSGLSQVNGDLRYEIETNPDFYPSPDSRNGTYSIVNTLFTRTNQAGDSDPTGTKQLRLIESLNAITYNTLDIDIPVGDQNSSQLGVSFPASFTTGGSTIQKSGVFTLPSGTTISVVPTISGVISQGYYNTEHYATALSNVTAAVNLNHVSIPATPTENISPTVSILLPVNTSVQELSITVTPRTPFNQAGTPIVFDSNSFYDGYPATANRPRITAVNDNGVILTSVTGYDSTNYDETQVMTDVSNFNLMNLSGQYRYPQGVYNHQGELTRDYDSISGSRYESFSLASYSGTLFTVDFQNSTGLTGTGVPTNYRLYARVDGATPTNGWVSLNDVYDQNSGLNPTNTEDAALVLGTGTDLNTKIGTFGTVQRTGTLHVLVIIDETSPGISFSGLNIT